MACLAGGCLQGLPADAFAPARGPAGVTLRAGDNRIGELLAVNDTALILRLVDGPLAIAPFRSLPRLQVDGAAGAYHLGGDGRRPEDATLAWLRAGSRYPQGLRPEWAEALLAERRQAGFQQLVGAR